MIILKAAEPQPPKLLHTKKQTAFLLSLSPRTIDNLVISKQLRAIKIGSRVMFSTDELQRFIRRDHPTDALAA